MNFKCALFGHKYTKVLDKFVISVPALGTRVEVTVQVCERCGKIKYDMTGICNFQVETPFGEPTSVKVKVEANDKRTNFQANQQK